MYGFLIFLFSYLTSFNWQYITATPYQNCKLLPSSPQWPSIAQWQALNESTSGRLLAPSPLCTACHLPFNNVSCAAVGAQWANSSWHAENPWSADYNDNSCLPDSTASCSALGYPAYVVEAHGASDVQAALNFARRTGVRLIVKGTGHDFSSRSSGPGSLSIWTHHIRGVNVTRKDPRAMAYGGVASVEIAAGMQWKDVYATAISHNLTVVGGGDPNVGIGGWILGGGHSPVSSRYGMGADQVLEMEVVTADGEYRVVNETSHSDLFWALRGGGGSTYAVLLSVTVIAYERLPTIGYRFSYDTVADSDTFWSLAAYFHQQLSRLSDAGAMGYYYVVPAAPSSNNSSDNIGTISGFWLFPEKTLKEVGDIMSPMENYMLSSPPWAEDTITGDKKVVEWTDFLTEFSQNEPQTVGFDVRLGSWLLDETALSRPLETLKTQLRKSTPPPWELLGHLVAGKGVQNATVPGGSNAVSPHWRNAYSHVVIPRKLSFLDTAAKTAMTTSLRTEANPALMDLAPESGAYANEADPTISGNWQRIFFGNNYPRLLALKEKWDPEGVFWCKSCVGQELWEVVDGPDEEDRSEWGVGQIGGRICRK
ncbi:uncharacterized protein TRUGW13939_02614 [Talaromyces rugulosus]|uniref:FAD-binding PCMH-type domain-containing protein n=1 Tax=Talaromyces rugulosus TaxID=121627 RepID=A0A7H8QNI6_TALRU|nr:uncharacterized protein TRUGW13939_02614 [Talaromyces rugulosus]QKX55520.1 hypothetical protein TRUGW13939_02614 [Talaromyces rugulosus]